MKVDIAVIGGGPAGLAAALGAYKEGVTHIVIIERIGNFIFREILTGPEYAQKYIDEVGLIPENELSKKVNVQIDSRTGGPVVDEKIFWEN